MQVKGNLLKPFGALLHRIAVGALNLNGQGVGIDPHPSSKLRARRTTTDSKILRFPTRKSERRLYPFLLARLILHSKLGYQSTEARER
jgi:hypothetical protein